MAQFMGFIIFLVVVVLYNTIKIINEYERGVVLRLGRVQRARPRRELPDSDRR